MKIIIGLGNPGKQYKKTRHNAGFIAVDKLKKAGLNNVVFLEPDTFMNNSGKAVKKIADFYKAETKDIWLIHDDIDLPLGEFKISQGQGSAGHKGVQSVINELKSKDFNRIRIGICPKDGKPQNVENFVLEKFLKTEEKIIKEVIDKAVQSLQNALL
jgi:PTH1 family peptidyl-tRNA hydrolase